MGFIVDYKNSSGKKYRIDDLLHLRSLQPALYCAALENMDEGENLNQIFAGFLPLKLGSQEYMGEYDDKAKEYLSGVISHVFKLFELGWFPINTDAIAGGDPCAYCDYTAICGQHKNLIAKRLWEKAPLAHPELGAITERLAKFKMEDA